MQFFLYPMKLIRQSELSSFGLRVWSGSVKTPYPPHRHNEIELNAIEQGYFTYLLAGRDITISAGEVGLFWGAIPHQVIDSATETRLYWGTIPLNHVLRWELSPPFLQAMLSGSLFLDSQPLYDLRFFARWEDDFVAGQQVLALMEIRALFFRFAQMSAAAPSSQTQLPPAAIGDNRANQMALFMSQHFDEAITVTDIAGQVGLHPNYAMTVFKATFGLSMIEYLTQQRIAHAQQRLIISDAPITAIALEAGFRTLSHFYMAFKRLCRMSPGKYRASLR